MSPLSPVTEVSPQPSALPGGNPPEDWQSAVGWGGAGFEPGTAGLQSDVLQLSHHAERKCIQSQNYIHVCTKRESKNRISNTQNKRGGPAS